MLAFRYLDCYSNVLIVYRILFIIPMPVVSFERSFSKLKLLRGYLRSTMALREVK
jgi:hypothetical protein